MIKTLGFISGLLSDFPEEGLPTGDEPLPVGMKCACPRMGLLDKFGE
jgi:hypothetical protein